MQALKGLVGGLGILIVIAMSVIGYGLYRKAADPGFKFFSSDEQSTAPAVAVPDRTAAPATAFGETMVGLPTGCAIEGVSGDGARIFLRIGPANDACGRVIILNAASGAQIGVIRVAR